MKPSHEKAKTAFIELVLALAAYHQIDQRSIKLTAYDDDDRDLLGAVLDDG